VKDQQNTTEHKKPNSTRGCKCKCHTHLH